MSEYHFCPICESIYTHRGSCCGGNVQVCPQCYPIKVKYAQKIRFLSYKFIPEYLTHVLFYKNKKGWKPIFANKPIELKKIIAILRHESSDFKRKDFKIEKFNERKRSELVTKLNSRNRSFIN